ncbi:MAG: hypothetical protein ACK4PR_01675, partial [Gammaproteobacteria bacterium]
NTVELTKILLTYLSKLEDKTLLANDPVLNQAIEMMGRKLAKTKSLLQLRLERYGYNVNSNQKLYRCTIEINNLSNNLNKLQELCSTICQKNDNKSIDINSEAIIFIQQFTTQLNDMEKIVTQAQLPLQIYFYSKDVMPLIKHPENISSKINGNKGESYSIKNKQSKLPLTESKLMHQVDDEVFAEPTTVNATSTNNNEPMSDMLAIDVARKIWLEFEKQLNNVEEKHGSNLTINTKGLFTKLREKIKSLINPVQVSIQAANGKQDANTPVSLFRAASSLLKKQQDFLTMPAIAKIKDFNPPPAPAFFDGWSKIQIDTFNRNMLRRFDDILQNASTQINILESKSVLSSNDEIQHELSSILNTVCNGLAEIVKKLNDYQANIQPAQCSDLHGKLLNLLTELQQKIADNFPHKVEANGNGNYAQPQII